MHGDLKIEDQGAKADSSHVLTGRYPELGAAPIPIEPYVSPQYFELEKKYVFKKVWIHVGRVEEIPGAGDYFVKQLDACDASILVVRNREGAIHAFHNVCSHRMNKMVYTGCGSTKKFFCKFHGWAYDLDGRLVGVPDEKCFTGLRREEHGLSPVHLEVWQGFIFVNFDRTPRQSLSEFLRPMYQELEGYPFEKMTSCYSWSAVVNCNWKLALDAFQETYHVSYVHGRSIASALLKSDAGGLRPLDGLCGEYHRRLSIAGNPKSVYGNPNALTSASNGEAPASANRPIGEAALRVGRGGARFDVAQKDLPKAINWTRHPNWAFDINVLFPDFYLSTRPNYYQAYNFRPLAHDKFWFDARVYYPEMTTAGGRFYQEYMKVSLRDVLLEDLSTLEHNQAACATRAKTHMVLQDFEIMVRHQFAVIERMISEGQAPEERH
jgi:phenylpropionate dioxygenase-like ring-hydroxylating dioxygenase large terminal subunit